MESKNLELLRPFDLEAAKRGGAICTDKLEDVKYVDGPDECSNVVIKGRCYFILQCHRLCMAPLAWVEGRPVYKGDALFYEGIGRGVVVGMMKGGDQIEITYDHHKEWGPTGAFPENLTWTPPKVKREGFAVVIKQGMFLSREDAEKAIKDISFRSFPGELVIAHAEWEEPAA